MGLWDWFRRRPDVAQEDWRKVWSDLGKVEARTEKLEFAWNDYRDQLNRLVQRLEKRDQRAAKRETAEEGDFTPAEPIEVIQARMLRDKRALGRRA